MGGEGCSCEGGLFCGFVGDLREFRGLDHLTRSDSARIQECADPCSSWLQNQNIKIEDGMRPLHSGPEALTQGVRAAFGSSCLLSYFIHLFWGKS